MKWLGGANNIGYDEAMDIQWLGNMNENDERFAVLCSLNQLVIGGSIFPHKRFHKATLRSPDNVTGNQIVHICTNKKCRAMEDVRVMRGAKISSDHYFLMTAARVLLEKLNNRTTGGQDTTWMLSKQRKWEQYSTKACPTDFSRYKII